MTNDVRHGQHQDTGADSDGRDGVAGQDIPAVFTECEQCRAPSAVTTECPYRSEVKGDEEPCACCVDCRRECRMEI